MKCSNCGRSIYRHDANFNGRTSSCYVCPSGAKRSEGLQACPPSATGSAGAGATDEAGADSAGRSAEANGFEDAALSLMDNATVLILNKNKTEYWMWDNIANAVNRFEAARQSLALLRLQNAPRRSVERVRLPNETR